jgi:hypothetical protein
MNRHSLSSLYTSTVSLVLHFVIDPFCHHHPDFFHSTRASFQGRIPTEKGCLWTERTAPKRIVTDAHSSDIYELLQSSWVKKQLLMSAVSIEVSQSDATSSSDYILVKNYCSSPTSELVDILIDCPLLLTRRYTIISPVVVLFGAEGGSDTPVQYEGQLGGTKSLSRTVCRPRLQLLIKWLRCFTGRC